MTLKKFFNPEDIFFAICAIIAIIFGCLALLTINPHYFWIDDMQSQHIPAYIDMANALNEHSFPLVSPYSWNGGRLAGELQYGIFSIFHLLLTYVICNLPISMPFMAALFCITYLALLSAGSYLLARMYKLPTYLSFLIATSLPFSGYLILWGTKSWFPILTSFAWIPWAWTALKWTLDEPDRPLAAILGGIFIYLLFAAGWPFTNFMILLIGAWLVITKFFQTRSFPKIKFYIFAWAIGILLSMPTNTMFFQAMTWSSRSHEGIAPCRTWMVPLTALWGLILPTYETFWQEFSRNWISRPSTELFCGITAPAMFLFVLWKGERGILKKFLPELILLGIVLFLATAPTLAPLQHSFRWLPLFHLVFMLLAALLWHSYTIENNKTEVYTLCASLIGIAAALLFARIALLRIVTSPFQLRIATYAILAVLFVWILLSRFVSLKINQWLLSAISLATLLISLSILPNPNLLPEWNIPENTRSAAPYKKDYLYLSLANFNSYYKYYNDDPEKDQAIQKLGNLPLASGVKFINGYSPTYPLGIWMIFLFGWSGFMPSGFVNELSAHPDLLDFLPIDGILIPKTLHQPIDIPKTWTRPYESSAFTLFERPAPTPLVQSISQAIFVPSAIQYIIKNNNNQRWSQYLIETSDVKTPQMEIFAQADLASPHETRLGILVDIKNKDPQHPALITFKRAWYPGYRAFLDKKELQIRVANFCMPSVQIPPNASGKVHLLFWPKVLTQSLLASAIGVLLIFWLGVKIFFQPRHSFLTRLRSLLKL